MREQRSEKVRPLYWSASGHGWFGGTDEVTVFVSEAAYEHHFKAYLAARRMEWKTLTETMEPAEAEWKRQCEATDAFRADLVYWLDCHDLGVQVWYPQESRWHAPQEGYALRWSPSGHGWYGKTNEGALIFMPEAVYEEHLRSYLARRGIELSVWTHIMGPAEQEWRRQCEAARACWADLDYWLNCHDPDVLVTSREEP